MTYYSLWHADDFVSTIVQPGSFLGYNIVMLLIGEQPSYH